MIKMPLGTEIGLGSGDFVLDGDPASLHQKGSTAPNFRPMSIVAERSPISATAELVLNCARVNCNSLVIIGALCLTVIAGYCKQNAAAFRGSTD